MMTTDDLSLGDLVTIKRHGEYSAWVVVDIYDNGKFWGVHLMMGDKGLLMMPWKSFLLSHLPWIVNVKRGSVVLYPQEVKA